MSLRIDELPQFFKRLIEATADGIKNPVEKAVTLIVEDMRETGKPSTSPVQWDSERQKAYVMMKLRKEGNIPYKRTGDYERSWKKTQLPNGWEVSAKYPAGAIGGIPNKVVLGANIQTKWQSRIHRGRWKEFAKVATERLKMLPKDIINGIKIKVGNLD